MEDDENWRKIFVGGLHYNTTNESLKAFYEKWGEVSDVIVMRDQATQRSRGFGFVTFRKAHMVDDCLALRPHIVDGKEVECKRAMPREGMQQALPELHVTSKKLFIGGLKDDIGEAELRDYFSQFGTVANVEITKDRNTGQRRGFGFVTFDDYDPVDKVILMGQHEVCGHQIAIKKALEREQKEMIASGMTVRGGARGAVRGAPGRGAPAPYARGGRGGPRGGGAGGFYNGSGPGSYGAPAAPYGSPPAAGGYGAETFSGSGGAGYSDSWTQGATGAGAGGGWAQAGGYGDPSYSGAGGQAGYGSAYGGGAMKGPGYGQRAAGPYGAGFGRGAAMPAQSAAISPPSTGYGAPNYGPSGRGGFGGGPFGAR